MKKFLFVLLVFNLDSCASRKLSMEKVLYVVDGVWTDKKSFDKISIDQIAKLTVLKGESAKALYGRSGRNGVILVATK